MSSAAARGTGRAVPAAAGRPARVTVVFNPATGGEAAATRRRDDAREALSRAGVQVEWLETTLEDPGRGICLAAVERGTDLVIACGGDGTVRECVTALAGTATPLAVLPAGTGNLLARNLGIPADLEEALGVALGGRRLRLDVGAVGDERFAVMGGVGFDAAMIRDADPELKSRIGPLAYVRSGLANLRSPQARFELRLDDAPPRSLLGRTVLVGNLGKLQGGVPVLPGAVPDDGLLDVAVITPRSIRQWGVVAFRVLLRRPGDAPWYQAFKARRLEVRMDRPQPFQLDGDALGETDRMVAEVLPGALWLCLPDDAEETS